MNFKRPIDLATNVTKICMERVYNEILEAKNAPITDTSGSINRNVQRAHSIFGNHPTKIFKFDKIVNGEIEGTAKNEVQELTSGASIIATLPPNLSGINSYLSQQK